MGGPPIRERRGAGLAARDGAKGARRCGPSELGHEGERGKEEGRAKQAGGPEAEKGGRVRKNSFLFS